MNLTPHDIAYVELRRVLRDLREAKQLTQSQLAKKLDVPQSFVSKYETGERRLDIVETIQICQALGIPPIQLLARLSKQLTRARSGSTKASPT